MDSLNNKKVLVLGHNGMLGHMVKKYLEQFYEVQTIESRWPSHEFRDAIVRSDATFLVDCIGAIPQRTKDFNVNTDLPKWLDLNFSGNIIHPATDCEMDDNEYGMSKRAATVWLANNSVRTKVIKTSIIGPEQNGQASLMNWFLSNKDGSEVTGYANHYWNGSTTHQWAVYAHKMIENWDNQAAFTIIGTSCVSKYDLLQSINKIYNRNIIINSFETEKPAMKCLSLDLQFGDIEEQIQKMKAFYENTAA